MTPLQKNIAKVVALAIVLVAVVWTYFQFKEPELAAEKAKEEKQINAFSIEAKLISVNLKEVAYTSSVVEKSDKGNIVVEKDAKAEIMANASFIRYSNSGPTQLTLDQMIREVPAGTTIIISGYGNPFDADGPQVSKIEVR